MHKHQFQFSSNWPNDLVCKHTCRTSKESCTGFAEDDVHAVRGTRLIPRGYYTNEMFAGRIPELLRKNPARIDVQGFEQRTPVMDSPQRAGDDVALTPGQLNDFELGMRAIYPDLDEDPELTMDLRCWGGDQVLVVQSFDAGTVKLATVFEAAREHWLRYHSSLRH